MAERTRRGDAGQTHRRRRQWAHAPLPDAVGAKKKSSTPSAPVRSADEGGVDKNVKTTNANLGKPSSQGKAANAVPTATSYFDPGWNAFAQETDGSMQFPNRWWGLVRISTVRLMMARRRLPGKLARTLVVR